MAVVVTGENAGRSEGGKDAARGGKAGAGAAGGLRAELHKSQKAVLHRDLLWRLFWSQQQGDAAGAHQPAIRCENSHGSGISEMIEQRILSKLDLKQSLFVLAGKPGAAAGVKLLR